MHDYTLDPTRKELIFNHGDGFRTITTGGVYYEEYKSQYDKLHREDGPAVIDYRKREKSYFTSNQYKEERGNYPVLEWRIHGKLHREDGPAVIFFHDKIDGVKKTELWYFNGKIKNIKGGPTKCFYDDEGSLREQQWRDEQDRLHRKDGPARISGYSEERKEWFKHGKLHRRDGPAVITETEQRWYLNGKRHRYGDEPAYIEKLGGNVELEWCKNDDFHRSGNQPATISFYIKKDIDLETISMIKTLNDVKKLGGELREVGYFVNGSFSRKDYQNPVFLRGYNLGTKNEDIRRGEWWKGNQKHRVDGPAIINGKNTAWYYEDELHCVCGPAVTDHHPSLNEWWVRGKRLKMSEVRPWLRSNKIDLSTEEGQFAFFMRWGYD